MYRTAFSIPSTGAQQSIITRQNVNTAQHRTAFGKYDMIAIAEAPSGEALGKALLIIGALELQLQRQ